MFIAHDSPIDALKFSESLVATADRSGQIILWKLNSAKQIKKMSANGEAVKQILINKKHLIALTKDEILVFGLISGNLVFSVKQSFDQIEFFDKEQ